MERHNDTYYQTLLKKYLDGSISSGDLHILEKRALDDPFLMDALEGYNENKDYSSVTNLERKLDAKYSSTPRRILPLYKYGIAASFIILIVSGLWFTRSTLNSDTSTLSDAIEAQETTQKEIVDVKNEAFDDSDDGLQQAKQYNSPKADIAIQDLIAEKKLVEDPAKPEIETEEGLSPPIASKQSARRPARQQKDELPLIKIPLLVIPKDIQTVEPLSSAKVRKRLRDVVKMEGPIKIVEGIVTNDLGETIAGGLVYDKTESNATTTDASGYFQLEMPQEAMVINVRQDGFQSLEHVLENMDTQSIQLSLVEVTADAFQISEEESQFSNLYYASDTDAIKVAPVMGIQLYKSYLQKSILTTLSDNPIDQEIEVVIKFKIDSKGKPQEIEVIKSGGFEYDFHASELIAKGGKWITSPPNMEVIVHYPVLFGKN